MLHMSQTLCKLLGKQHETGTNVTPLCIPGGVGSRAEGDRVPVKEGHLESKGILVCFLHGYIPVYRKVSSS